MRGAIQKGFDEAQAILGELPDPVQEDIDKTHEIVFQGLDDFVASGLAPEKRAPEGVYARIEAYRMELSLQVRAESLRLAEGENAGPVAGDKAAPPREALPAAASALDIPV